MRTGQPIIGRPAWYDRNPQVKLFAYTGLAVTPHTNTQRWQYTVPPGKKAMLESLFVVTRRRTAATTLGDAVSYVGYTPSGGAEVMLIDVRIITNVVGDKMEAILGQSMIMLPGDKLTLYTADGSTGGTVDYINGAKITEFDA